MTTRNAINLLNITKGTTVVHRLHSINHPCSTTHYIRRKSTKTPSGGSRTPIKLKINKKDGVSGPRPGPDPGRLVNQEYINNVPIDLSAIPELEPSQIKHSNVGKSFKFNKRCQNSFQTFDIPKSISNDWKPMSTPITTLRKASVDLIHRVDQAVDLQNSSKPNLLTLTGENGTGKSVVLLHALSYAVHKRWIVLYIPDAKSLVDGQYSYQYCSRTQTYHQNTLSADILRKLTAVNDLEGLKTSKSVKLFGMIDEKMVESEEEIPSGVPLSKFVQIGIQKTHLAPNVLEIVLDELAIQTQIPVFFAIDGAQNLFKPSDYVDGSFRKIDSFGFNVPRLFLKFARGTQFWSKGMTILSGSSLHKPSKSIAWDKIIKNREPSIAQRNLWPGWNYYEDLIKPVQEISSTLYVDNLSRFEAIGVAQILELQRLVLAPLDERVFLRHYICSNGNVREFTREIRNQIKL